MQIFTYKNVIWNSKECNNQCIFAHLNKGIAYVIQKTNFYFPT
jgi:hypothetical protein